MAHFSGRSVFYVAIWCGKWQIEHFPLLHSERATSCRLNWKEQNRHLLFTNNWKPFCSIIHTALNNTMSWYVIVYNDYVMRPLCYNRDLRNTKIYVNVNDGRVVGTHSVICCCSMKVAWHGWRRHLIAPSPCAMPCQTCQRSETVPRQRKYLTMEMLCHISSDRWTLTVRQK